jgi:hypothetical protein
MVDSDYTQKVFVVYSEPLRLLKMLKYIGTCGWQRLDACRDGASLRRSDHLRGVHSAFSGCGEICWQFGLYRGILDRIVQYCAVQNPPLFAQLRIMWVRITRMSCDFVLNDYS